MYISIKVNICSLWIIAQNVAQAVFLSNLMHSFWEKLPKIYAPSVLKITESKKTVTQKAKIHSILSPWSQLKSMFRSKEGEQRCDRKTLLDRLKFEQNQT
jgi:hypothetical protein